MAENILEVRHLKKWFKIGNPAIKKVGVSYLHACDDVSFEIRKGEIFGIIGESGSGKSTLIRLLLKEAEPTSGRIVVNDMDLQKMPRRYIPKYRRRLGVVFQDFRLLKDRTVFENVAFAQRVVGASPRKIREEVPRMLKLVGLSSKYKSFPHQLSGGEQQRVAIARALASDAKVLLADEPTGNLDTENGKNIIDILKTLAREQGYCVIVVTHDLGIAAEADEVLHLSDGMVKAE